MKKIIAALMLCFVSILSFSQIESIQPQKLRFEYIGKYICYDTETGDYDMVISSDNQYEHTMVHLNLGKSVEDVMKSLKNLESAIMTNEAKFEIDGFYFYVSRNGRADVLHTGKLAYAAGSYFITTAYLHDDMIAMIEKYNLPYGNVEVVIQSLGSSYALLKLKFNDYDFIKSISLDTNDFRKSPYS